MSSTTTSNVMPMMHVGLDNFELVKYLVSQVMLWEEERFEALKVCDPRAKKGDRPLWRRGVDG
ncbi:malate dehydrogenase [Escherichia coli]|nr:malate dehydrogenase [Escherichia coli]